MKTPEEIVADYRRLCSEFSNTITTGPFIEPNGKTGEVVPGFSYAGFNIRFTADNRCMNADIFATRKDWLPSFNDLWLRREQMPFDFQRSEYSRDSDEHRGFIRLRKFLEFVYCHAKNPTDVLSVLNALAPAFPCIRFTPLNMDCFTLIHQSLSHLGYAVSAMSPARDYVRSRIVWIPEPCRVKRPLKACYPTGTLRTSVTPEGNPKVSEWLPLTVGEMQLALHARLLRELPEIGNVLSQQGIAKVAKVFQWKHGLDKNLRRVAHERRIEFIVAHRHLWADINKLTIAIMAAGLFSPKTVHPQIVYHCKKIIDELQDKSPLDYPI